MINHQIFWHKKSSETQAWQLDWQRQHHEYGSKWDTISIYWLVVWNIFYFSIYWEYYSHLTNIFQRGRSTINQYIYMSVYKGDLTNKYGDVVTTKRTLQLFPQWNWSWASVQRATVEWPKLGQNVKQKQVANKIIKLKQKQVGLSDLSPHVKHQFVMFWISWGFSQQRCGFRGLKCLNAAMIWGLNGNAIGYMTHAAT